MTGMPVGSATSVDGRLAHKQVVDLDSNQRSQTQYFLLTFNVVIIDLVNRLDQPSKSISMRDH